MKENTYKTLQDIADYINESKISEKEIRVDDVVDVFEKTKLVYFNHLTQRVEPTTYLKNSNGCFLTKYGKILFTKAFFDAIINGDENYTSEEWLQWFMMVLNSNENEEQEITGNNKVLNKYFVVTETKFLVFKCESIIEARQIARRKYGRCLVRLLKRGVNI